MRIELNKKRFIDLLNVVYVAYVLYVISFLLLIVFITFTRMHFSFFKESVAVSLLNFYGSWIHIVILAVIGSIMPKTKQKPLFFISTFCSLFTATLALASATLAFSKTEYIVALILMLVYCGGFTKSMFDYVDARLKNNLKEV